jgi:DNA replication protein DnaC
MSFSKNCILANVCKIADTDACNTLCQHYIALHGASGRSGRISNANTPLDYRLVTIHNSPTSDAQEEAYKTITRYVDTFKRAFEASGERIKSIYLYSAETGTGKTTTACAVMNEWIIRHYIGSIQRGQQPLIRPAYFLDVNEWQTWYNEFNRNKVPDYIGGPAAAKYYDALKHAQDAPLVVLDDIGVRTPTEGFRADLHSIVNHRVSNQMPMVYTSNVPIADLEGVFGERRLADRVRDMCVSIEFAGKSKRGIR